MNLVFILNFLMHAKRHPKHDQTDFDEHRWVSWLEGPYALAHFGHETLPEFD